MTSPKDKPSGVDVEGLVSDINRIGTRKCGGEEAIIRRKRVMGDVRSLAAELKEAREFTVEAIALDREHFAQLKDSRKKHDITITAYNQACEANEKLEREVERLKGIVESLAKCDCIAPDGGGCQLSLCRFGRVDH